MAVTSSDTSNETAPAAAKPDPPAGTSSPGAKLPIEQLVKSLAAVTAVFYVVGFLTTNAYLYKLGVSDFSLLRTRFVLTGVLTLLPLVLALVGGIYAAVDTAAFGIPGGGWSRASLWILGDVAAPFVLYVVLFWLVADNDLVTSVRDAALLSVSCAAIVLALLASVALYRKSGRRPVSHLVYRKKSVTYDRFTGWFGIPDAVVENLFFVVAGALLLLAYIGVFGHHFYPMIPEQIGGGRPRVTQLLIAADAIPAVRELGLQVNEGAPLSPPLELLWEGEETYIIRLPSPHHRTVVQLARGLVDGVVTGATIVPPEFGRNPPGHRMTPKPLHSAKFSPIDGASRGRAGSRRS